MSQFSYSNTPDPANGSFYMTQSNSASALIVWLYLVTNRPLLNALEVVQDWAGDFDVDFADPKNNRLNIAGIVKITNLTPDTVRAIIRQTFLNPNRSAKEQIAVVAAFQTVVDQFQTYSSTVIDPNDGWQDGECPGIVGVKHLAQSGATVDPGA